MTRVCDIIRDAADNYLWKGGKYESRSELFSCCAITSALAEYNYSGNALDSWLREFGVDPSVDEFRGYPNGVETQSIRYAWLMLIADIAEEEEFEI